MDIFFPNQLRWHLSYNVVTFAGIFQTHVYTLTANKKEMLSVFCATATEYQEGTYL